MEDDSMEIDETITTNTIVVRESTSIHIIGGQLDGLESKIVPPPAPVAMETENPENSTPGGDNDKDKKKTAEEDSQKAQKADNVEVDKDDIVILDDDDEDDLPLKKLKSLYMKSNDKGDGEKTVKESKEGDGKDVPINVDIAKDSKQEEAKEDNDVEVIDLVKTVNSKCINYACLSGVDMITAPNFALSYYRIRNAKPGKKEICRECYAAALQEYDKLAEEIKEGRSLFNIPLPVRNDTFEIDDSSDEEDNEEIPYLDDENIQFLNDNFERVLNETMQKLNFKSTVERELQNVHVKKDDLKGKIDELQSLIKETRNTLDSIQMNLYKEFRNETVEANVISIIDDHYTSGHISIKNEPVLRKSQRVVAKKAHYGEMDNSTTKDDLLEPPPKDIPQIGVLEKPQLFIDEIYYISREQHTSGSWIKARLKGIIQPGTTYNDQLYTTTHYKMLELKQHKERVVNGKCIAAMQPPKIRLETGTRIIAVFKEIGPTGEVRKTRHDAFYPGIVAEPPVAQNKYRYLIFFDIGYSQYVSYTAVHAVFEASKNVWEDMHVTCRPFIKKYLESQDRPMVKLAKGQLVRTEYNGKWVLCTILDVDCSLVLVFFDSLTRVEWIYRGSTRLSPMFKEEQNAAKRHTGGRPSANNRINAPDESATIVQYTKNSDFEKSHDQVRAVARKSTARPEINRGGGHNAPPGTFKPFLPPVNSIGLEPTSKIMYFTPRDQVITQRVYQPHICSPTCKDYVRHHLNKLRGHNPLSKPLLCGWARITQRVKGKKEIMYKAPCSRILRNMEEIHQYLRMTNSEMTVDLFDFNNMVRCLAEFNVECEPEVKDLSKGLEQVAVPVINGINNDKLAFSNYTTKRTPMEDVPLNVDPEFLCGCDCEDDCVDKEKCHCWRLTLEGAKYMGKNVDPMSIGYVYRRLPEQVLTGIYECNSRCKCASTCLNRVVQNPMSIKLQVFKTHNRGWGIRCVNDVPQGTFICIYAGTIHTEQMANEDGQTYGDEYFAELDYIENCEKHKEDYEEDVIEPDSPVRSPTPEDDDDDDDEEDEDEMERRRDYRKWKSKQDDSEFLPYNSVALSKEIANEMRLRRRNFAELLSKMNKSNKSIGGGGSHDSLAGGIETVTISDDEDDPKEVLSFNPKATTDPDDVKSINASIRTFFGEDEPYIMDTKNAGNIGRFLNHSCSPNVFVQNVFVDTHDVRFPWVAFFCSQFIRAGTELTWNYNYDIGSVPGRVLYCHCGSLECKGRLL